MMQKQLALIAAVAMIVATTGCGPKMMYHWGGYENALYASYKNPEKAEKFEAVLADIMADARKKGKPIPPGIVAEYGFIQFKKGEIDLAIEYFELEKELWPESEKLMNTLIQNVQADDSTETEPNEVPVEEAPAEDPVQ